MDMLPMDIEKKSMEIIESELDRPLDAETAPIVKRVIHTTADFSFADSLYFSPGVVGQASRLLRAGALVITDTNMAAAGVNKGAAAKLGVQVRCFMAEPEVAEAAKRRGTTRAAVAMERALELPGPKLLAVGNAPTALMALCRAAGRVSPGELVVIGVPVGFVNVVEAKEQLIASGLPAIVSRGRRGGSNVAAAIVNALRYRMEGVR